MNSITLPSEDVSTEIQQADNEVKETAIKKLQNLHRTSKTLLDYGELAISQVLKINENVRIAVSSLIADEELKWLNDQYSRLEDMDIAGDNTRTLKNEVDTLVLGIQDIQSNLKSA